MESDSVADTQLPALTIPLQPVGGGNTYKISNSTAQPYHRPVAFDQMQGVHLSCECLDIIHGRNEPGGIPATLVVFKFRFEWTGSRRIKRADVYFDFFDDEDSAGGLEVDRISYEGGPFLYGSSRNKKTRGVDVSLVVGPPVILANTNLTIKRNISNEYWAEEGKSITGTRQYSGTSLQSRNCARWTFEENKSERGGIVREATVSMLLLRKNHPAEFYCNVSVKADADWLSNLQRLVGTRPDDPIKFDPTRPSTNRLWKRNDELSSVPIKEIGSPFTNVVAGPTIVTTIPAN